MALASRTLRGIRNINRGVLCVTAQKNHALYRFPLSKPFYSSLSGHVDAKFADVPKARDPAPFFFNDEVQSCLLEMNLRDTSKVFQPRRESRGSSESEIKFLTQEELEKEQKQAMETAKYYLQVPPVLAPSTEPPGILSRDPALQGLEEFKILFTDISLGLSHRKRLIVARDPDGTLRHASMEERSRMIHTYFPNHSRTYTPPQLFSEHNLRMLLEKSEFVFILDRACSQYEPDEPEYVSLTSFIYNFIDDEKKYDDLRGTRHYGAMAFYFVFNNKFENFLDHCIVNCRIEDAVSLIRVYYLVNPQKEFQQPSSSDDTAFVQEYIAKHSKNSARLSKSLNAFLELNLPTAAEAAALHSAIEGT